MAKRPSSTSLTIAKYSLTGFGLIASAFGCLCLAIAYLAQTTPIVDLPEGHHLSYLNLTFWQPEIVTLTVAGIICLMLGGGFLALTLTFRAPKHEIDHDKLLWDIENLQPAILTGLLAEPMRQIGSIIAVRDVMTELELLKPKLIDRTAKIIATLAQLTISDLRPLVNEIKQAYTLLQAYQRRQAEVAAEVTQLTFEIDSLADAVARAFTLKQHDDSALEALKSRLTALQQKLEVLSGSGSNITRLPFPAE